MEKVGSVGCGPVRVVWRFSRVAGHAVVIRVLREKLSSGIQFFGVQERCHDRCGGYVYRMVLWTGLLREDSRFCSKECLSGAELAEQKWRSGVEEVSTELDRLSLASRSKREAAKSKWLFSADWSSSQQQSVWDIKSCGAEEDTVQFVRKFVQDVQWSRCISEEDCFYFGEIAFEYCVDAERWREEYGGTVNGKYVGYVEKMDAERP
jgi:hypothetical protein